MLHCRQQLLRLLQRHLLRLLKMRYRQQLLRLLHCRHDDGGLMQLRLLHCRHDDGGLMQLRLLLRYRQLLRLLKMHCHHDGCGDDDRYDHGSGGGFYVRMRTAYQTSLMS
jgi:hypothetical protein